MSSEDPWTGVTALVDPSRRALFDYVRRAGRPVSREAAADAVGISRSLAAFHLDRLVDAGLLRATYAAPAGQPRGRPPKVYEATDEDVVLTVPDRRYQRPNGPGAPYDHLRSTKRILPIKPRLRLVL